MEASTAIQKDPWEKYYEIEKGLGAAQVLVAGLENRTRSIQRFLVQPLDQESSAWLESILKHFLSEDYCLLIAGLIFYGVERRIEYLKISLAFRKYPDIDIDTLLDRLRETSIQIEMLYGRIGIIAELIHGARAKIASCKEREDP